MSEYYAVQRSTNHLAHYGVKGMKWGVRKAVNRGNNRLLAKHYVKASKKLAKLQNNANMEYQKKRIRNATEHQKIAGIAGATNIGVSAAMSLASRASAKRKALEMAQRSPIGFGVAPANVYLPIGAGVALGDIAARQIGKNKAKKLASKQGHKDAIKKANEFRNEMQKAFKGTKYANNIGGMAKDIAAKKRKRIEKNVEAYDRAYSRSRQGRIESYASKNSKKRR